MGSRPWLHHFATSWLGRGFLVCNPTALRPDGENGAPKNGDRPALRAPKSFIFQESKTGKKTVGSPNFNPKEYAAAWFQEPCL